MKLWNERYFVVNEKYLFEGIYETYIIDILYYRYYYIIYYR